MTVLTATAKAGPYAGSGTTGPFTVPFRFLEAGHLRVIRTSTAGIDADLLLGTGYTVSGVGASSGSVTLVAALAVGEKLTVVRSVPVTQQADYVAGDGFPAESHEQALDLLTMIAQQHGEQLVRAVKVPVSSSETPEAFSASLFDARTQAVAAAAAALQSEQSAENDATQTELDRQATAADRVATGLDRTATGFDRIATAADRVQTGLDRDAAAQSAADAAQAASAYPTGGTAGQVLTKVSADDFDAAWEDPAGGAPAWADITGKPTFATVATSGAYADLSGKPALGSAAATAATDYATAAQGALADSALQPGDAVPYADLSGVPSTFPPAAHGHAIADVTGLQTELDGKQPAALVLTNTTAAFTSAQESKLAGIAPGATANATDAQLRDRATHTGTQAAATISDFAAASRAQTEAELVAGTNITITPSGTGATRQLTIAASGGGSGSPGGADTQVQFNDGGVFGGAAGWTWNKTTNTMTLASGTQTADNPAQTITQTWNNAGATFTGLRLNVTDTASNSASLLADFQVGGVSRFAVKKDGTFTVNNAVSQSTFELKDYAFSRYAILASGGEIAYLAGNFLVGYSRQAFCVNNLGFGSVPSNPDTYVSRESVGVLSQIGPNPQTSRIYGSFTDAGNHRRLSLGMSTAGVAEIKPEGAGTGASGNVLHISGLPTSNPGPGILWNDAGTVKVGT